MNGLYRLADWMLVFLLHYVHVDTLDVPTSGDTQIIITQEW